MSYLEISLSKKGVDIFQLSYSSVGIIFFGETFMVKWSYNNITNISLKNIKSNMLTQLQNTFVLYFNVFDALYRMTLLSEAIQKYLFYLYVLQLVLYQCTRMYINIWYWSV